VRKHWSNSMPAIVSEVMNAELFSLSPDEQSDVATKYLLDLGISAAPVLDEQRRVLGVTSLRDLLAFPLPGKVQERMTRRPLTIAPDATLEQAASLAVENGVHHLVVVDGEQRAVGFVSALDLMRGLLGLPGAHPPNFPHYDAESGVYFTDDTPLELDRVPLAPDGPGVLCLTKGGRAMREIVVWAEAPSNVRTRLYDLLSRPQSDADPRLQRLLLDLPHLRFRAASVTDAERRRELVERLMSEATRTLRPAAHAASAAGGRAAGG
jgi:CBS domain-containing protein